MSDDLEKLERKAYISTNLVFVLADVMELALGTFDEDTRKVHRELRFKDRQNFNACIHAAKELRSAVKGTDEKNQWDFGDASEDIYEIINKYITNAKNKMDTINTTPVDEQDIDEYDEERRDEVKMVKDICESIGYGHAMSIASALWRKKFLDKGETTTGVFVPALKCDILAKHIKSIEDEASKYDKLVND